MEPRSMLGSTRSRLGLVVTVGLAVGQTSCSRPTDAGGDLSTLPAPRTTLAARRPTVGPDQKSRAT